VAALLAIAAAFELAIVGGVYAGFGRALPTNVKIPCDVAYVLGAWAWLRVYGRRHGRGWPLDMGFFLYILGVALVVPCIFKVEGRRGWGLAAIVLVLWLAAQATGAALAVWIRVLMGVG
jgi:hypothetical protein